MVVMRGCFLPCNTWASNHSVLSLHYVCRFQGLYLNTSRELKRLDALAFSPIFQHYAESLNGLPTIRAFQRQQLFEDINRV